MSARREDWPIPEDVSEAQMRALDDELPEAAAVGPYQYRPMIGSAGRIVLVLRAGQIEAIFMGRTPTLDANLFITTRSA